MDEHSSLLQKVVTYGRKKFCNTDTMSGSGGSSTRPKTCTGSGSTPRRPSDHR
jgi:hypothetical protein